MGGGNNLVFFEFVDAVCEFALIPLFAMTDKVAELGFKDFAPPFKNTCENHGGSGLAAVQQWDAKAKKWNMITEYMYGDSAVVKKLIAEDSAKYAAEQKIAERCN